MIRYIIRGLIDGSLSTLGVVIGASFASPIIIISAAFGGALANGFSNILGAFSAEYAIRYREFRELERHMMKKLGGTRLDSRTKKDIRKSGFLDGGSTILGGIIPIIPFLLLAPAQALWVSIAAVIILMGLIGIVIGRLSKENILWAIGKMVVFTAATAGVLLLIQQFIPLQ
jgi:predicted membrane protein (TIGR00267 family)